MKKKTIECPNCQEKFKIIFDDENEEEVGFCAFCAEPLDYDIEPLDFD